MNPSRTTELKVGLFTLVGLAILIGGIMWGRQISVGGSVQMMTISFPTSSGLVEGDPVTVNGVKKGRVEKIDIAGNGVVVHASLEKSIALHSDVSATIMMLELMGGKKIDVRPGIAAASYDPAIAVSGVTDEDIPSVIAQLGGLSGDLKRVLFRADTLLGSMNHLLSDSEFVASIRHTIVTLDATVVLVKNFVARNQGNMEATLKDARAIVADIKDFFATNRPEFEKLLKKADKTFSNVDGTIAHADTALIAVDSMMSEIKHGDGTAHKLIYDKEFAAHLDSTMAIAHRFLDMISEHGVNINVRLGTRP